MSAGQESRAGEHQGEKVQQQWSVKAENGRGCYASQDVAEAVAAGDSGYTLGLDQSPLVRAFTRPDPDAEWTPLSLPPAQPGAHRFDSGIDWNTPPESWSDPCCDQDWSGPVHQVPCQECSAVHDVREPCHNDGPDDGETGDQIAPSSTPVSGASS